MTQTMTIKQNLMKIIEGDYDLKEKVDRLEQEGFKKGEHPTFNEIRRGIQEEIKTIRRYEKNEITAGNKEWVLQTIKTRRNQGWKYLDDDVIANVIKEIKDTRQYQEAVRYLSRANKWVQSISENIEQDLLEEKEEKKPEEEDLTSQEMKTDTLSSYETLSAGSGESIESQIKQMTKKELRKLAKTINELLEEGNTSMDDVTRAQNETEDVTDEDNRDHREKVEKAMKKNLKRIRKDEKIENYERHEGVRCRWAYRNKYCPVTCATQKQMEEHFDQQHRQQVELQEKRPKEADKYRSGIPVVDKLSEWMLQSDQVHEPNFRQFIEEKRMFYKCNEQRKRHQRDTCDQEYKGLRVLHAHLYFCHKLLFDELPGRKRKAFKKELEKIEECEKSPARYQGIPTNRKKEYKKVLKIMEESEKIEEEEEEDKPQISCPYFTMGCTERLDGLTDIEEHMKECVHRKRTRKDRKKLSLDLTKITPVVGQKDSSDSGVDNEKGLRECKNCNQVFDIRTIGSQAFYEHMNNHEKERREKEKRNNRGRESSEKDSGSDSKDDELTSGNSESSGSQKERKKSKKRKTKEGQDTDSQGKAPSWKEELINVKKLPGEQQEKEWEKLLHQVETQGVEERIWKEGDTLEPIPDLSRNTRTTVNLREIKFVDEFNPDKIEKSRHAREIILFIRDLNNHLRLMKYSYEAAIKILRDRLKGEALAVMEIYEQEVNEEQEESPSFAQIIQQLEKIYASDMLPEKCDQELQVLYMKPEETVNGFACRVYQKCEMAAKLQEPAKRAEWITKRSRKIFALRVSQPERTYLRKKNNLDESSGKPPLDIEEAIQFLEEVKAERKLFVDTARSHKIYGRNPREQIQEVKSHEQPQVGEYRKQDERGRPTNRRPYRGQPRRQQGRRPNTFRGNSRGRGRPQGTRGGWQNSRRENYQQVPDRSFNRGRATIGKGGIRTSQGRNQDERNWEENPRGQRWQNTDNRGRGMNDKRGNMNLRANVNNTSCYKCGIRNHFATNIKCPLFDKPMSTFACRKCNRGLHDARDCPLHFDEKMHQEKPINWKPRNTQAEKEKPNTTQETKQQKEKVGKMSGQEHQLNPLAEEWLLYEGLEL